MAKVFTVYDSKAEMYLAPFTVAARGQAVREFESACNDPKTMMCKHPSDFTLFEIGEFDDLKGTLKPYEAKVSIGTAIEFKKVENGVGKVQTDVEDVIRLKKSEEIRSEALESAKKVLSDSIKK